MNVENNARYVQSINGSNLSKSIISRQIKQDIKQTGKYDTLELSTEGMLQSQLLNVQSEMKSEIPREFSIDIETLESRINFINDAKERADRLKLSFGERLTFLKDEGKKWVEDIRQNDPEMFVQWLKNNKENIQNGRADLASLPSDFMMKEYYSYVKESFSALV